jgi:hypothetical protein
MASARLAHFHATVGAKAVLARQAELKDRFTSEELRAIAQVPKISLALVFAVSRFESMNTRSTGEISTLLDEGFRLRRIMLHAAQACGEADLVPAGEVEAIRRGTGRIDNVQDMVDLAAFYWRHAAALAGKTPVTDEMIARSAELGTLLTNALRPAGAAAPAKPAEIKAAAERRDRIWTLLQRRYDLAWKAGAVLFGRHAVDDHVPPLLSRPVVRKPAPAATPTA